MPQFTDTIASIATPTGPSALAVLRVSGPDTPRLARAIAGDAPPPRRLQRRDYRSVAGELLDDVLLVYFEGPRSYTGEDTLEVSCHGNPFIAQKILEDLFARGCRSAEPGEFTQRAFLNGRMDLSQAEAVMDLIRARSDRALAAAHQQLRGALGQRINGMISRLLNLLAQVEAYIDFPDEDLPAEDRTAVAAEVDRQIVDTAKLLATSHYGELLRDGVKTVIIGPPNVGKSSLLNRLVGKDRALVSPEPGTTRDFIEERLILGPHQLRLIDTAGLNPSPAPLERLGMEKTLERAAEADLYLVVAECGAAEPPEFAGFGENLSPSNCLIILNKSDIHNKPATASSGIGISSVIVSARTGAGMDELTSKLIALVDGFAENGATDSIAINARHANALQLATTELGAAKANLLESGPVELLASDLRMALNAYGEIGGRVDNERMLDALFASFCIGK